MSLEQVRGFVTTEYDLNAERIWARASRELRRDPSLSNGVKAAFRLGGLRAVRMLAASWSR